jgi:hypothetical protein
LHGSTVLSLLQRPHFIVRPRRERWNERNCPAVRKRWSRGEHPCRNPAPRERRWNAAPRFLPHSAENIFCCRTLRPSDTRLKARI